MKRSEKIEKFFREEIELRHIDVMDYIDANNVTSFQDVYNQTGEGGGFNVEIIYYSRAMQYLMDNDTSLYNSMQLAIEHGYSLEDINSEVLASLLASQHTMEELYSYEHEIDSFFEMINNQEDEQE
jgi:hypothetical protein